MNYVKNNIEAVKEYIGEMSNSKAITAHNQYCQNNNYSDNEIFDNDEDFFNTHFEGKVLEAVRAVSFGSYQYNHDYVKFDGYANLQSFNDPFAELDINEMAEDMLKNPNDYNIELEEEEETEEA